jgi:hypothetical protein
LKVLARACEVEKDARREERDFHGAGVVPIGGGLKRPRTGEVVTGFTEEIVSQLLEKKKRKVGKRD